MRLTPPLHEDILNRTFVGTHEGESCIIVGGGPSVIQVPPESFRSNSLIIINIAVQDPLFAAFQHRIVAGVVLDEKLLDRLLPHIRESVRYPVFTGNTAMDNDVLLEYLREFGVYRIPSNHTEGLGDCFSNFVNGGNSGYAAIQLAILMGFKRIGLVGFDGAYGEGKPTHYHTRYSHRVKDSTLDSFTRLLDSCAEMFRAIGVEIVNLSPVSQLTCYPKVTIEEWNRADVEHGATPVVGVRGGREFSRKVSLLISFRRRMSPPTAAVDGTNTCFGGAVNIADPYRDRPLRKDLALVVDEPNAESTTNLGKFRGLHHGQEMAVLGSGPTLNLYEGTPALSIAVNGASEIHRPYTYFICGDKHSPERPWFTASEKWQATRIVASFVAPFDPILYPDPNLRADLQADGRFVDGCFEDYSYEPPIKPIEPQAVFRYDPVAIHHRSELPISRDQETLLYGGSIAGVAVQFAFIMGASKIHLFGCSMDNEAGSNYASFLTQGNLGRTLPSQIVALRRIITSVGDLGTQIEIHGPSPLKV